VEKITGSLQQKGSVYYAVLRVPDLSGKSKQVWRSTKIKVDAKTKRKRDRNVKAATKELERLILEYEAKTTIETDVLFVTWLDEWLERKKNQIRLSTWEGYAAYASKHIRPFFEPLRLKIDEVAPRHIQRYIDRKHKEGQSVKSIKLHMGVIRGVLDEAVRFNAIPFNPAAGDRVKLPKAERFVGQRYTVEQSQTLIKAVKGDAIEPVVMLGLFLGLRRSEMLGLRWQDVDFVSNTVHIRNTVVKVYSEVEAEQTKSDTSMRDLPLMPSLKSYLFQLKAEQDERRQLMGDSYHKGDHVCVWPDGRPLSTDYVSHRFGDVLNANGLPHIRLHDLRHTAGSILLDQVKNPKLVQEFLGHSDIQTTLNLYTHTTAAGKREAGEMLDAALKI